MSFYTASKKADDVKQGGSNHIIASGLYPVTVLAPVVSVSKGGSTSIDLFVDHLGQQQIIYGNLRITNNDKSPNKIGAKVFNQLMIIAGLDDVAEPVEMELPIGKAGALKTVPVLEGLMGVDVLMRVQMEYSTYQGNIQEKKNIKSFFRASDNATAEEIVNDKDHGKGFEREQKYVEMVTYKDGLDEAAIKEWISKGRPEGTAAGATEGSTSGEAPPFGKKRFGQSSD
jgi:hypothetical protein